MHALCSQLVRLPAFWRYLVFGENAEWSEDLKLQYLRREIDPDIPETEREYYLAEEEPEFAPVCFVFSYNEAALELEIEFDSYMVSLGLRTAPTNAYELGWVDHARAAPFCLRWVELEALTEWGDSNQHGLSTEVVRLLLARFVGVESGDHDTLRRAQRVLARDYESLGVFSTAEAKDLAARTLVPVFEKDYRWHLDEKLGWMLSGEYPGYSLRFRNNERFPFQELSSLMRFVGVTR